MLNLSQLEGRRKLGKMKRKCQGSSQNSYFKNRNSVRTWKRSPRVAHGSQRECSGYPRLSGTQGQTQGGVRDNGHRKGARLCSSLICGILRLSSTFHSHLRPCLFSTRMLTHCSACSQCCCLVVVLIAVLQDVNSVPGAGILGVVHVREPQDLLIASRFVLSGVMHHIHAGRDLLGSSNCRHDNEVWCTQDSKFSRRSVRSVVKLCLPVKSSRERGD